MFIKPAPDRKVRRPDTFAFLPESGAEVPDHDPYWHRRLAQGDVVKVDAPKPGDVLELPTRATSAES